MMPVIVTHWSDDLGYPTRTIRATTNLAIHLRLTHSLLYPVKTPRFIRERGKDRICGYYLRWVIYTCHDQLEPNATTEHTFTVAGIPIGVSSWCCIAESCHPLPQQFATPPIPLAPVVGPPPVGGLILTRPTPQTFTTHDSQRVEWSTIYAPGPPDPPPLPSFNVPLPTGPIYSFTARITLVAITDATFEIVLAEDDEHAIDQIAHAHLDAGHQATYVLSGPSVVSPPVKVDLRVEAHGDDELRSVPITDTDTFIQIKQ